MTEDMWQNVIGPEVLRQCDILDGVCLHNDTGSNAILIQFIVYSSPTALSTIPEFAGMHTETSDMHTHLLTSGALQFPSRNVNVPPRSEHIHVSPT